MALDQRHFRFGINELAESTHGWHAAEDANPTAGAGQTIPFNTTFLLRFVAFSNAVQNNVDFTFQYSLNGGTWTNITTSSAVVKAVDGILTNGGDCTQRLTGQGGFDGGAGQTEDGTSGGGAMDIPSGGCGETEIAIQLVSADLVNGDVVRFRLLQEGSVFGTYTVTPTLTIVGLAQSTAGGMTPAGTLAFVMTKKVDGGATPSATVVKQAARTDTGGMTPAATLLAETEGETWDGSGGLTPAGVIAKQAAEDATGGLTPAGVITKQAAGLLDGDVGGGGSTDLGNTSIGGETRNCAGPLKGIQFTMPEDGALVSASAYVAVTGGLGIAMGLYSAAGNKIAQSAERTDVSTAGWYLFTGFGSVNLEGGLTYYLVVGAEVSGGTAVAYFSDYSFIGYADNNADISDAASLPATATFSADSDRDYSVYLTYTLGGGGLTGEVAKSLSQSAKTGGIASAASLFRQMATAIVASLTPTGEFIPPEEEETLDVAGGMTPTGVVAKQTAAALPAGITPTGTVAKTPNLATTGGITSVGAVVSAATKALVATMVSAGVLAKQLAKTLTGGNTPAGTASKQTSKTLNGEL